MFNVAFSQHLSELHACLFYALNTAMDHSFLHMCFSVLTWGKRRRKLPEFDIHVKCGTRPSTHSFISRLICPQISTLLTLPLSLSWDLISIFLDLQMTPQATSMKIQMHGLQWMMRMMMTMMLGQIWRVHLQNYTCQVLGWSRISSMKEMNRKKDRFCLGCLRAKGEQWRRQTWCSPRQIRPGGVSKPVLRQNTCAKKMQGFP